MLKHVANWSYLIGLWYQLLHSSNATLLDKRPNSPTSVGQMKMLDEILIGSKRNPTKCWMNIAWQTVKQCWMQQSCPTKLGRFRIIRRDIYEQNFFMMIWHCRSQLKNIDSSGIWTRTFEIPVRRSTCWDIEFTGIGGKILSNLTLEDILPTAEVILAPIDEWSHLQQCHFHQDLCLSLKFYVIRKLLHCTQKQFYPATKLHFREHPIKLRLILTRDLELRF